MSDSVLKEISCAVCVLKAHPRIWQSAAPVRALCTGSLIKTEIALLPYCEHTAWRKSLSERLEGQTGIRERGNPWQHPPERHKPCPSEPQQGADKLNDW